MTNHLYLFASLFDDGVPAAGEAELVEGVGRALRELFERSDTFEIRRSIKVEVKNHLDEVCVLELSSTICALQ